jgi:hypothetical protein
MMCKNRMKNIISIRPSGFGHIIILSIFGFLALFFTGYALYSLFLGEPMLLFDFIVIESRILQFILFLLVASLMVFFFLDSLLLQIYFEGDFIIALQKSPMRIRTIKLECKNLIAYRELCPGENDNGTIYQYLELFLVNGGSQKLWVKPYSKKQVERILLLIQERGGLQNQNIVIH